MTNDPNDQRMTKSPMTNSTAGRIGVSPAFFIQRCVIGHSLVIASLVIGHYGSGGTLSAVLSRSDVR
jgi:hypothetical protein